MSTLRYESCDDAPPVDRTATVLSSLLIAGLVASYLPQHLRIIIHRSSQGFSNGFLFLGATSGASSLLNVITLQRQELFCCSEWGANACLENSLGIIQMAFQWACFNLILVLFVLYFPVHQRYRDVEYVTYELPRVPDKRQISLRKGEWDHRRAAWTYVVTLHERTNDYWYAHIVAYGILIHFVLFAVLTAIIIDPRASLAHHAERIRESWAIFLGVFSSVAAALQYLPQIRLTWRNKLVGSLSIPMMCIQSPGSAVFVYSLAIRPHVNWTAWITFAITGCLQACLLIMCIAWKRRQRRLGIDDYGRRLQSLTPASSSDSMTVTGDERSADERTSLLSSSSAASISSHPR